MAASYVSTFGPSSELEMNVITSPSDHDEPSHYRTTLIRVPSLGN
jgi:hypothetical protein